ncbi:MAG TPA: prolipoprotein diacylglyceryl transferase [Mycobacteriales bacterium]|nr:prolipoprotein diacylglyceryl transferase [Mycobacteriales bacterium]
MTVAAPAVLASIPSPPDSQIDIGPFPLRAYALAIIVGVFACVFIGERRWAARGGTRGTVGDIAVVAVPMGIVGGRIYHVLTSWDQYADRPVDALKVWEGGLGIPGGLILGTLTIVVMARRRGVRASAMLDVVAPGVAVAQAIGRLGNWFNQELFGRPTDLPWALRIDLEHRPAELIAQATYHPTFLYELLWNLVVAAIVVLAERRWPMRRGRAAALYAGLYALGRFFIEGIRIDDANSIAGLRTNEITALVVLAAAVAFLIATRGKGEDDRPVETSALDVEGTDGDGAAVSLTHSTQGRDDAVPNDGPRRESLEP